MLGMRKKINMELQSKDVHEDRLEARIETEQPLDEGRKRKRNFEEIEQGQEEEVTEFVSDSAFVLWEKSLKGKDFIVERGFNKLISHLSPKLIYF